MTVQEEIGRLADEAEDLSEFIRKACALLGKGVTRASMEAGLSRNTFSSWVKGGRRPSAHSAWRAARYFGVREDQILRLAGIEFSAIRPDQLEDLAEDVHRILASLDEEEVQMWIDYGDLLVLGRQRRMMEERWRRSGVKWKGSETEKFVNEHEDFFRWLLWLIIGGLVVRFVLEGFGLWPWP